MRDRKVKVNGTRDDIPFEIESPVEFVLVGTLGRKRSVIAKSVGAKIDLIAYAQKNIKDQIKIKFLLFSILSPTYFKPIKIKSVAHRHVAHDEYDSRLSDYTFVFRGVSSRLHSERLEEMLNISIDEISSAIDEGSTSKLEWILSSIIQKCDEHNVHWKIIRTFISMFLWLVICVCLLIYAAFLFREFPDIGLLKNFQKLSIDR